MRSLPILIASTIVCLGVMASAPAGEKSDAKIKASASASKLGADGKQTVTITLEIEKGWYIYANPMNANTDILDGNETVVAFKIKDKVKASVKYPAGKQKKDGKYEYDIYEGKIVIQAEVQRPAGDAGPLQVSIAVNTCRKGECLLPATVMLTVP